MKQIGEKIRTMRNIAGFTQEELAKLVGLAKNTILNYEKENRSPTGEDLIKIADALNTTVAYLTGETDNPAIDSILPNDLDSMLKELGAFDPELVSRFRNTSEQWDSFSDIEKQAIVDGLRFVLGRVDVEIERRLQKEGNI